MRGILARPAVPTVVVGLGKPGVMLTVLGRKIGAPWTYAALERGMEPVVLEAGPDAGHAVRQWSHVRMFSPWSLNQK